MEGCGLTGLHVVSRKVDTIVSLQTSSPERQVMKKYGMSLTKLLATAGPDQLIVDYAGGLDPAIHGEVLMHFYPFGGLKTTAEWIRDFRARNGC